jgi:hypothetical protein
MDITREKLLARIEALKTDLATCQKQIILFDGALQDAEYWLAEFDKSEQKENNDA